jgi:hypothetical protein
MRACLIIMVFFYALNFTRFAICHARVWHEKLPANICLQGDDRSPGEAEAYASKIRATDSTTNSTWERWLAACHPSLLRVHSRILPSRAWTSSSPKSSQ